MAITTIKGSPVSAYATHATSAVATIAGVTGAVNYITDIAGSSDKAGSLLTVKQGTTVVWETQLAATAAGNCSFCQSFMSPIPSASGASVSVTVDGTSVCKANIAGYQL